MIVARDAEPGVRTCSQAWAKCLREEGFDVSTVDVTEASATATAVIVAPHAALRPLSDDPLRLVGVLERSVCISTSRLGSGALGADRPFHRAAAASVALSRDAARYLSAHGLATAHLKPGAHPSMCSQHSESRTLTVGTHARYSSFREDLIARSRDVLDPHSCDLRISRSPAASPPTHLEPERWLRWLTSVDVLISLPQDAGPGTEWCEVAPAVLNGAVVLTTAESDFHPLEPGEDVSIATGPGFADSLRRLLADDARRERMRASALARLLASPLDVSPLADAIQALAAQARRARPFVAEAPKESPLSPLRPEIAAAHAAAESARAHRERIRSGGEDQVTTTAAWDDGRAPTLSVVIPSWNQAAFVADAVQSALGAVGVDLEVVIVDDGSSDASATTVRELLQAHPGRMIKLVELADNRGLAAARNRGFLEARAPLVLLLDADDELLPHAPVALVAALQADPEAAFAYGLVARSGLAEEDLLGTEAWDPLLFRCGNYIPVTCSLVRRSAWELVGGYSAEGLLELGWEDMDFWMRLAEAGARGAHVRRIVGTYRVHGESMSTLTNLHADSLEAFMRERHPSIMGAHGT
jgi:GT2 family glycosyltransferase